MVSCGSGTAPVELLTREQGVRNRPAPVEIEQLRIVGNVLEIVVKDEGMDPDRFELWWDEVTMCTRPPYVELVLEASPLGGPHEPQEDAVTLAFRLTPLRRGACEWAGAGPPLELRVRNDRILY